MAQPRYVYEARVVLEGDIAAAQRHIPLARTLLGDLYTRDVVLGGNQQASREVTLAGGVTIRVRWDTAMPCMRIHVPGGGGGALDTIPEYRGLLRALQDADEPCEPLVPPTGTPGEDGYDPGEVSELHPLYEVGGEEWLLYPNSISIEHNDYPNHPLPPRGGTFIMDMIAEPFDRRAFNVRGKPPLQTCKMLVTGGGTYGTQEFPIDEATSTYGPDDYIFEPPPKSFRIGRRGEMPGWPWTGADGFIRLVSIKAVLKVPYDWFKATADFTIEFLRLNGEPYEVEDDPYLEPVEFTVENIWPADNDSLEQCYWYDFTVLSLTRTGNKAVLGLNQAAYLWERGICLDYIILDLDKWLDSRAVVDLYKFFDRYWSNGPAAFYTNKTFDRSNSRGPLVPNVGYITLNSDPMYPCEIPGVSFERGLVTCASYNADVDIYFPSSYNESHSWEAAINWYLRFDEDGNLVRYYYRNIGTYTFAGTQSLTTDPSSNEAGTVLNRFMTLPMHSTDSSINYSVGDVVYRQDGDYIRAFYCVAAHTASFSNRPGYANGSDTNPTYWRAVYGFGNFECGWLNSTIAELGGDIVPGLLRDENGDPYTEYLEIGGQFVYSHHPITSSGFVQTHDEQRVFTAAETHYLYKQNVTLTTAGNLEFTGLPELIWSTPFTETRTETDKRRGSVDNHYCINAYLNSPLDSRVTWRGRYRDAATVANAKSIYNMSSSLSPAADISTISLTSCVGLRSAHGMSAANGTAVFMAPDTYGIGATETYLPPTDDGVGDAPIYFGGQELSGTSSIAPFPIDGIGIGFATGYSTFSLYAGTCISNQTVRESKWKKLCYLTVASLEKSEFEDITVEAANSYYQFDYLNAEAMTDPMPYVPKQEEPDLSAADGLFYKPVVGPEKGVLCDKQQICYVGWVYPTEMYTNG